MLFRHDFDYVLLFVFVMFGMIETRSKKKKIVVAFNEFQEVAAYGGDAFEKNPLFFSVDFEVINVYILRIYTIRRDDKMETAKLFQNGSSQAVRLPKAFRIPGNEVKIYKNGKQVILEPIETTWDSLFDSLSEFPEDFMKDGRNQPAMQKRESF